MPSQTLVNFTVTRATSIPTRAGFGTILAACYHSLPGPLVREYGSIDEVTTAFASDPNGPAILRLAAVVFSQSPSPTQLKIGKRTTGSLTQIIDFAPVAPQGESFVWSITVDGRAIRYTEGPGATVASIVAGLVASADWTTPTALDVTPTDNASISVRVTAATPNVVHSLSADILTPLFTMTETTLDPGIATDLTAFQGTDEDWYGLVLDSDSQAEVVAAATWVEARVKLLGADCYLSDVPAETPGNVAEVLATAQREKTYTFWSEGRVGSYYAAGIMAYMFSAWDPGRATWHLQPLLGVPAYLPQSRALVQGRQSSLEAQNVMHLEPVGGQQRTQDGKVAVGEFIDVIRYQAYIAARARENALETLKRQTQLRGKVPFTDAGIALVLGPLQVFLDGEVADNAAISATVSAPLRANIAPADVAERLLPDVDIAIVYAGAIHTVTGSITLSL